MEIKNSALLLAGPEFSLASTLKAALKEKGYELIYVNSFESFIDHVVHTKDCIIFIDKNRFRFLRIIKALVEKCSFFQEHMIVYLTDNAERLTNLENGSNVVVFNYKELVQNLSGVIKRSEINKNIYSFGDKEVISNIITEFLLKCGLSPKYVGFDYIVQIVLMCANNNFVLNKLQKDIYPKISLVYKVPVVNIERNIRSAITYLRRNEDFDFLLTEVVGKIPNNLTTKTFVRLILLYVESEFNKKLKNSSN